MTYIKSDHDRSFEVRIINVLSLKIHLKPFCHIQANCLLWDQYIFYYHQFVPSIILMLLFLLPTEVVLQCITYCLIVAPFPRAHHNKHQGNLLYALILFDESMNTQQLGKRCFDHLKCSVNEPRLGFFQQLSLSGRSKHDMSVLLHV